MLASKNRFWAAKTLSKIGANLDPINPYFEVQVGLHVGGGLGSPGAPEDIFLEAPTRCPKPLQNETPPVIILHKESLLKGFQKVSKMMSYMGGFWEACWGLQKVSSGAPAPPAPKMEPNLDHKKSMYSAQVELRFGTHVGAQNKNHRKF